MNIAKLALLDSELVAIWDGRKVNKDIDGSKRLVNDISTVGQIDTYKLRVSNPTRLLIFPRPPRLTVGNADVTSVIF